MWPGRKAEVGPGRFTSLARTLALSGRFLSQGIKG